MVRMHPGAEEAPPAKLGRCRESNADRRAAAWTFERRERRLGLPQRWNEPQIVGIRQTPLALGASKFSSAQLRVRRL